jgi:hypothetical protein
MPTLEYQVTSSEDDGFINNTYFYNDWVNNDLGYSTNPDYGYYHSFNLYKNIDIPKNAVISSAYITLNINGGFYTNENDEGSQLEFVIYFNKVADPTTIVSISDFNNRVRTTQYHYEHLLDNVLDYTANVTNIVQEIVDQDSWVSGNNMLAMLITTGVTASESWVKSYESYEYLDEQIGAILTISWTPEVPSAPDSCSVSRVNDNQHNISWNNNPTDLGIYDNIYIERWDNVTSSWYVKESIDGALESYSDTTTIANRTYQYRVRAGNESGYSNYSTSSQINTTPAAPTNIVAIRSSGSVILTWTNPATNEDSVFIQKNQSLDSGETWQGWVDITPDLSANSINYTDTSPYTYGKYRVRTESINPTLNSDYVESNDTYLATPSIPTLLVPDEIPIDGNNDYTFTWNHNPDIHDGSDQTKFSLRYRVQGDSWPGTPQYNETSSSNEYVTISGSTFTNDNTYEWQVKTWGDYATGSDWSDIAIFYTVTTPEATITNPTDIANYGFSTLTLTWEYTQTEGNNQTQYIAKLYNSSNTLLETKNVSSVITSGSSDDCSFTYNLSTEETYTVTLQVKESIGLWSELYSVEFDVVFYVPSKPSIELSFYENMGAVLIDITNPDPEEEEIPTSYNKLYRVLSDGTYELVYDNIPVNTTVIDYVPILNGTNQYFVMAVSAIPTINDSFIESIDTSLTGMYFLHTGANYSTYMKLYKNVEMSEKRGRKTVLRQYEGRTYPVKYQGIVLTNEFLFKVEIPEEDREDLVDIIESVSDIMYRDWTGRKFKCTVIEPSFNKTSQGKHWVFSCNIIKIEE